MLRASAKVSNTDIDLQGINGDANAADEGIEFGVQLMRFAEALASLNNEDLVSARDKLLTCAGPAVLVDAAGVAANFQRMVRIADSMGIPVDNMETEMGQHVRSELGIERFASAHNSGAGL